jgi:hypothetical protein
LQKNYFISVRHSPHFLPILEECLIVLHLIFFAGNALEDLNLDEPLNLAASIDKDLETDSPTVSNSISAGLASSGKHSHCLFVISD